jgi:hypothetical protein
MNYSKFNAVWQPGTGSRLGCATRVASSAGQQNPVARVVPGSIQRLRRLTHTFAFLMLQSR